MRIGISCVINPLIVEREELINFLSFLERKHALLKYIFVLKSTLLVELQVE